MAIDEPESALTALTEQIDIFLPSEVISLLEQFIDRTLRGAAPSVLLLGVLATFWARSAASRSLVKAADLAYEVEETQRLWKLFGISVLMIVGLALLIVALALVVFSPHTGGYIQTLTGLPDIFFISSWNKIRWVVAFLTITLALDILYYLAPDAEVPFRWITPGGLSATILILLSSLALNLHVSYIRTLRPTLWTGWCGHSAHALDLCNELYGSGQYRDKRHPGSDAREEKGDYK